MEMNFHPARAGVAGAGLGLGIAGTALGVLNGGLGNILGGGWGCNRAVTPAVNCCSNGSDAATLAAVSTMIGTLANIASRDSDGNGTRVTRYDLEQQKAIIDRDAEIAYLKGRDAAKTDSLEMYKYVDGRLRGIEAQISQQMVYNATNTATIGCLSGQVNTLMALTKTVIPGSSICPEMMPLYNSWTAPTAPTTAG
jgi:hypothetical protein